MFIIHDADRHTVATEASNNAKALIITANDHGSDFAVGWARISYHNRFEASATHFVAPHPHERLTEPVL